ncbi:MAG TPA: hypothetical protein VGA56_03005 [Opitutaceae bacterium]
MIGRIGAAWRSSDPFANWYLAAESLAPSRRRMTTAGSYAELFTNLSANTCSRINEDRDEPVRAELGRFPLPAPPTPGQGTHHHGAHPQHKWNRPDRAAIPTHGTARH